jgi:putative restriction endonuclease
MLTREALLDRIRTLRVYRAGNQRAPHKPLLLLWALGRLERGPDRLVGFREADPHLERLLRVFGRPETSSGTHYPFWHLQSDQVWEMPDVDSFRRGGMGATPAKGQLLDRDALGGFPEDVFELLRPDRALCGEVAGELLSLHFPDSLHEEILAAVGLDQVERIVRKRPRSRRFSEEVLEAYSHRCAVCRLEIRLEEETFLLEAAHIYWHQYGGSDEVTNGLALCRNHHQAFDKGAYTVDEEMKVVVSALLQGERGLAATFLEFNGKGLLMPRGEGVMPDAASLAWHRKEVFRGPERRLA